MDKSQMFTQYNKARAAANQGKLDELRVNRALSVLQSADGEDRIKKYGTTIHSCNCPDRLHHKQQPCKHMIAAMVLFRANQQAQAQKPKPAPVNPHVYTSPSGDVLMAEQLSGGYILHIFESSRQYADWHNIHLNARMVKPSEVRGRKIREENHKEF